jgi:DNA-binding CsgD family transcriptional regulator
MTQPALNLKRRTAPDLTRAEPVGPLVHSRLAERDDLRKLLDAVPGGVLLLDPCGTIVCANGVAETLLHKADGLRVTQGVLTAVHVRDARELAAAIARMADAKMSRPDRALALAITVSRSEGPALAVLLLPLRPGHEFRPAAESAGSVLALIHDPAQVLRLNPALIAKLHGLTPTEAELAAFLAEGRSLAEFAAARGCSEQTARTHMKRILDKTGARRQADLVRMLLGASALHRFW